MRSFNLATLFSINITLASAQSNFSAKAQATVPPPVTTDLPSLTTNASFSAGAFSYIIPFDQSQQCDIFGPLCQTGPVTVGVSLASSTTTTILPCSSYLTEQAAHLLSGRVESGGHITQLDAREWLTYFGRSPECSSYAGVYRNQGQYTLSDCGSRNAVILASEGFSLPTQIPPGVVDQFRPLDYACCGNCTLKVPEVRLLYFPDQAAPQCEGYASNSSAPVSAGVINKRVQSLNNTGSIAVFSGHTFTSPSVYLQVVGTAAMRDECGDFGPTLTNPIITLPPNVLSTYVPPTYSIGSTYTDPNVHNGPDGFVGDAKPLNIAELQCPTFGLGVGTSADGSVHTTVGPPWLPIIIPPPEVFTLDPVWEGICTDLASYYVFYSFAIYDPPIALVPHSNLLAPSPAATSKDPPNVPANPTMANDPPATDLPDLSDPPSSSAQSIAPPIGNSHTPQNPPANSAQPAAIPLDPAAKPTATPNPPNVSPSEPEEGNGAQSKSPGLGSSIFSALEKSDPQPSGSGNADPTHIIPVPVSGVEEVTVGDQILSINPSGVYLGGTSYSPEGPAITLSGGVFSLVSTSSAQEATTPDEYPPTNNQPFTPSVQTIAGHDVISNISGVYVAGSSLSPGGGAITASNTKISLSPAGTLVVGSSSIALSLANTQETPPTRFKVDGVTVQAEPSAAVIDGVTLTPGGPGTDINGKGMSLEQGGTLVVGTSRIILPTAQETTPSAFNFGGMTVQAKPSAAIVNGITLTPGGPGTEINGKSINLERGGDLVVGTSRLVLPVAQETPPSTLNMDGMTVQLDSSAIHIDGTTLTPGGAGVSISGKLVSLEPDRTLDIGASQFALPPAAQETPPNEFSIDGMAVQAQKSAVVINGVTLTRGGPGTTIDGNRVSLEGNSILDIGSSHFALPPAAQQTPATGFRIDGMAVQAQQSAVVINGVTLQPGSPGVSIDGNRVSLEGNRILDIGTSHFALPLAAQETSPPIAFNLDGLTVQPQQSAVVVNGVTLTPGGPGTTIDGTSVRLEPSGTLDIGTGRFAIPTGSVNGTGILRTFEGAQGKAYRVPGLFDAVGILVLGGIWMIVA